MGRTKAKNDIPPQQGSWVMNLPVPPARKSSDFLKAYKGYPYAAITAISQEIANMHLHLYRRKFTSKGQKIEEVFDHPALSLLYNVNPFMTSYQLWEITGIYGELLGEAYWFLSKDSSGQPVEIWPLRPDWISIIPGKDFINSYKYSPGGVNDPNAQEIPIDRIVPFKSPNPESPYRGKGATQAAAMAIDTDDFSATWNRNFFFNSAVPYLILRTKKKPNKEEMDRFMAQWQAKFQGQSNSHKIAMLTGDWEDPFVFGDKIKDMDFIEQRRLMRDEMLSVFRTPKSVIGITEDVNRANADATIRAFMERVITPKMMRMVTHLNEFYLPNWGDEDLFFDFEDPAPEDVELNLKIYESGKGYWLTPNEIRERENLPPLDGGDIIPVSLALTPLEDLSSGGNQGVSGDNANNQDNAGKSMKVLHIMKNTHTKPTRKFMISIPPKRIAELKKEALKNELKVDMVKLIKNYVVDLNILKNENQHLKKNALNWTVEQKDQHWEKMIAKTDVFEQKFAGITKKLFKAQHDEVIKNIKDNLKHYAQIRRKDKAASFLFSLVPENKKWKKILAPYISHIVADKGKEILDFLGIDSGLDLSQQRAQLYLRVQGLKFISEVNGHTIDRLKATLSEGLGKEEGIPELASRVDDVFDIALGSRSEKIARTEVLRSTNFATTEAYRQSGVVEGKEWLTARDERVDDECAALDGNIVELDSNFKEGGISEEYPPLHPNCRCTLLPVLTNNS